MHHDTRTTPAATPALDVEALCHHCLDGYQRGLCTPLEELDRLAAHQPTEESRLVFRLGFQAGHASLQRHLTHHDALYAQGAAAVDWNRGTQEAVRLLTSRTGGLAGLQRVEALHQELARRADTPFSDGFHAVWNAAEGLVGQVEEACHERDMVQEILHQVRLALDDADVPRLSTEETSTDRAALRDLAWRVRRLIADRHVTAESCV
ncbi:MAG: hypothetical protein WC326_15440 [Candidatus Delongbacteria bacterium]